MHDFFVQQGIDLEVATQYNCPCLAFFDSQNVVEFRLTHYHCRKEPFLVWGDRRLVPSRCRYLADNRLPALGDNGSSGVAPRCRRGWVRCHRVRDFRLFPFYRGL